MIAPGSTKVEDMQVKSLEKAVCHLKEEKEIGLDFVTLDIASVRVVVSSDTSLTSGVGMKGPLGL